MLLLEHSVDNVDNVTGRISCDGKISIAGYSVIECLDYLFKMFWVFGLAYPAGVAMFFKFLQFKVYNISYGKERIPSTVNSVARLFQL